MRGSDPYKPLFSNCTSRVVVVRSWVRVPLARGSDPNMSLFSKCSSRVVVVRSYVRFPKFHSRVVVIR